MGAGTGGGSLPLSVLQIWRRTGLVYIIVGFTLLTEKNPSQPTSDPNVYEYIPSSPLEFHKGDILGVYTGGSLSPVMPYYQDTTGPYNVAPLTINEKNIYPLVTVETSGTLYIRVHSRLI